MLYESHHRSELKKIDAKYDTWGGGCQVAYRPEPAQTTPEPPPPTGKRGPIAV